ncbi:hypothetical protein BJY52DRAFT_1184866 [Lactarius psammicola]|nr:hypothetical protein BJY52DRAFT_1184866 [Lactarius psammicola]
MLTNTFFTQFLVTTKPPNEVHTHYEFSSAPLVPKNNYFPGFNVTKAYASPVWKLFQNSRREFEEFEWHLRCATLLFFNWLVTIYRLWLFAAWYIFTCASQAFLVKILIPQLFTVRHSALVWVLAIVDVILSLALEAIEVSVELARRANKDNGPVFDGWKNSYVSVPIEKTVKTVDVSASGATITVLYDPLPTAKNVIPMGRAERLSTPLCALRKEGQKPTTVLTTPEYEAPASYPLCLIRRYKETLRQYEGTRTEVKLFPVPEGLTERFLFSLPQL